VEWSNPLNHERIAQAPVLADGWLFVGDDAGTMFTLNPNTGQLVHQIHFPGGGFMPGVPFVDGQTIFVSTRRGMLFARPLKDLLGGPQPHSSVSG
jgi:outer membrane protein assembly factor BamB